MFLPDSFYVSTREHFVSHGYAWVSVDVRGTGASFGHVKIAFSEEQVEDSRQIVDWIVGQPWSDGQVGGFGSSYDGICADLLLALDHPAVKCVMPIFSPHDLYEDIAFPGGIFLSWFFETWSASNRVLDANRLQSARGLLRRFAVRGVRPADRDRGRSLLKQAVQEHGPNWDPYESLRSRTYRDEVMIDEPDHTFDAISPHSRVDPSVRQRTPVYSYSGWFDADYSRAAVKRYFASKNEGSRLTLGPWDHGGIHNVSPTIRGKSRFDHAEEARRFFDRHMKGTVAEQGEGLPVRYYTMIEDRWKQSGTWPPDGVRMERFYLGESYRLLFHKPEKEDGSDGFEVDGTAGTGPKSRWRTLTLSVRGATLYPDRREKDGGLLCYTSDPLEHDLEVTGHPMVRFYMSARSDDAALFVYLEDVDPSGAVTMVTEGQLRALHRKLDRQEATGGVLPGRSYMSRDARSLAPGEVAELVFDMIPTSYLFRKGNALRIAVAGADPDNFAPLREGPDKLHLHRSSRRSSYVELPVAGGM
jgi:putative CocE/NonD family hydrolase